MARRRRAEPRPVTPDAQYNSKLVAHLILCLGVVVVAFPVYLTFIASTHQPADIVNGTMELPLPT